LLIPLTGSTAAASSTISGEAILNKQNGQHVGNRPIRAIICFYIFGFLHARPRFAIDIFVWKIGWDGQAVAHQFTLPFGEQCEEEK